MTNTKWSDSAKEGKLLRRILDRLNRKEKKMPEDIDLETLITFAKSVAFVAEKKANLAHKTDFEERLKYLESLPARKLR